MKWNLESDNELKRLINEHHNHNEISQTMGRSIRSVQNRVFRLGLKINLIVETTCLNCGEPLKRCRSQISENSFCSTSCAASHNNKKRKHSDETKEKIRNKLKHITNKKSIKIKNKRLKFVKVKKCGFCNNLIPITYKICNECKFQYYGYYRPLCEFKFNLSDYPNEFDFKLIENHGWYSPTNKKNNLSGVSRDHMYCVRDGFINKINPEIIKHPANCKLMIHNENNKKGHTNTITIGELLERIKWWNLKYGEYWDVSPLSDKQLKG
jgi:hypothetical protein